MSAANLIASAPEIAPSQEILERLQKLHRYRGPLLAEANDEVQAFLRDRFYVGPVRTECDDQTWDLLRAALKHMVSEVKNAGAIGDTTAFTQAAELMLRCVIPLLGLKESRRPVKQLIRDFCSEIGATQCWSAGEAEDIWEEFDIQIENTGQYFELTIEEAAKDFGDLFVIAASHNWPAAEGPPPDPADDPDTLLTPDASKIDELLSLNPTPPSISRFTPHLPNLNAPRTQWIVKNVVPRRSLVVMYGKWGTGKSTLAIELCAAIARGIPWHGRKVQCGSVVYVASENEHGFRARLDAYLRENNITMNAFGGRFLEITGRPHLLRPDEVRDLIKELRPFGPSLIVVDTLARATAGADENAAKEMGILVENCQCLMNETGATVLLIHHTGEDESRGMRGSSSLPAACDTEIILERPDEKENLRAAKLGKQRDAPDYCDLFSYELKVVEMGTDEDGDKVTSTVVHEVAEKPESGLSVVELHNSPVRRAIRGVLGDAQRAMPFEELVTAAMEKLAPPDSGERDRRRERLKSAYERMLADRELNTDERGMVSLLIPGSPFKPVPDANNSDPVGGES